MKMLLPIALFALYTRQVVWIDSAIRRVVKTEYYDRKDALLKTLTIGDYRQYAGTEGAT